MAKDVGRYGAQANVADLQFQLSEKMEKISQLEFQLETAQKQEETALRWYKEKKDECLKLEESLADIQSELGKWKFMASQKGTSPGDSGRRNSKDLESRVQTLQTKNKQLENDVRALESEKRRLQQQVLFTPAPPPQRDSGRVQQLEEEVYKLQQANTTLDQRLRSSQNEQQKLHVDLKYARAELGEAHHRLQEKTQENFKNRDIIAHLESRQRDGVFDSTTQARIRYLEDYIVQLEQQQKTARRMSEPSSPSLRRQLTDLKDENAALKAEAITYQEDFLRERDDRGKEHSRYLEADARAKRAEQRVLDLEAIVTALNN